MAESRVRASGSDLWTVDVERNVLSRLTFARGFNVFPIWSPDGRTVLFSSGSTLNLFRKDSSGTGGEERVATSEVV